METRGTSGFTLLEMLTVIVIIGIILAIGIPAFTNLMKSGGLGAAARQVSNTLTLARQYAITQRANVRVVFPYSGTGGPGTNYAPIYQSYAVVAISGTTTNYLSKWEHLPLGTVFMSDNPTPSLSGTLPYNLDFDLNKAPFPFPYTNSPNATLAYVEFRPWGAASPGASANVNLFTITEGVMNGSKVTPTSRTGSNTLANAAVISVDNVVGRIQVTRP